MKKVTVVGAGFAALTAARKLRLNQKDLEITLVAPKPQFVYMPSLIWIPTGRRSGNDITIPLERFFSKYNINYHEGSATGLEDLGRTLVTSTGRIKNDAIIIASGGSFLKKLPGIEYVFTPCEGVSATTGIRDRLKTLKGGTIAMGFAGNPKEASAIRGAPMFEFLFGIDTHLRKEKRRDKFKLVFFTPVEVPGFHLGPKAVDTLRKEMDKRDIETHIGQPLTKFTKNSVVTEGGEFSADLILFMPGMTGQQWFDNTELPRSPGGMIQGDKYCRVEGWDKVYVAGDSSSLPGPEGWKPRQAHMADLQSTAASANMLLELNGEPPSHTFRNEMICIIDSNSSGMFVARNEKRRLVFRYSILFHWMKRGYEWWYLRKFR